MSTRRRPMIVSNPHDINLDHIPSGPGALSLFMP
jgi:hypothetical protein